MARANAKAVYLSSFHAPLLLLFIFLAFWGKLVSAYEHEYEYEEEEMEVQPYSIIHHQMGVRFPPDYPKNVPLQLMPPSGYCLGIHYYASGYQIYSFNGSAWLSSNVSAELRMRPGKNWPVRAIHVLRRNATAPGGLQPTWINFRPYSLAGATILASVPVDPNPANANWVLLQIVHNEGHLKILGSVKYSQRLRTLGGVAPTNKDAKVGDIYNSPLQLYIGFGLNAIATCWMELRVQCQINHLRRDKTLQIK